MTNKEIAKNLFQIAEILEVIDSAKNRFRVLAYEKAAQTVENMSRELSEIYRGGGKSALEEIEGIGESIALSIEEMVVKGKSKLLEELKKEIPASELEFLTIPGIGPKMAAKITKELKAKNIKDLKKKLESGVADKFFKEKTKKNLLRGIELLSHLSGRMLLTQALPLAEEIVKELKKVSGIINIDWVGSLRRSREDVGDIDIVCSTKNPASVIERFATLSGIKQVLTKGESKSTIIYSGGEQIDLEIVPQKEYGSLLQHFTGSKEHNVALRTYAQTKNMSVSEHGIKFQNKLHTFETEKGVYNFLGMDFIVPELRENRGEIEAALAHNLPKLVEQKDIRGDLHVHSNWSDGTMTIEEIAKAGEKLGYEYIVISDHTVGLGIARGLDEKRLELRQKEIEQVQKKHKIKILSSVEVNIKADGSLDIKDWMLEKMDIVTASIHGSFFQDQEKVTARLISAIRNPHVDIIGHPSTRIIGRRDGVNLNWPQIFEAASKYKTALEISSQPDRLDLQDFLCQEAKKYGVKFAINTDAHSVVSLNLMIYGVAVARRGWLTKDDIVNTKSLKDLENWLKQV